MLVEYDEVKICKGDGRGWFLPLTRGEQDVDNNLRALVYAAAMIYFFLGVSVVADCFMNAIETIAATRRQIRQKDGRVRTEKIWNETVATLSLMALGSSAPEIFLSLMESVKKEFHFGVLGPATIVGSAAFNLLVIVAVCIMAIPSTEVRRIKDLPTFYITVLFSIIAYVWMVVILVNISTDEIQIWEAMVTLGFFFLLVWVSYKTDVGDCDCLLRRIGLVIDRESHNGESSAHIAFTSEMLQVHASTDEQTLEVRATLSDVFSEDVSCTYRTEAFTAIPGYDYTEVEGRLEFPPGRTEAEDCIRLAILPQGEKRATCKFFLILEESEGGAEFNPNDDGGADSAIMTVTIASKGADVLLDRCLNFNSMRRAWDDWGENVTSSFFVNGSREEQGEASCSDWAFHICNFPWKFLFSFIPPTSYASGWITFFCSLFWIAFMSAVLADLAEMFGCVLEIPDIMTAITFVALGTSMPDLFASLTAARQDPTADASVVNVTGSNAVNVFLGLGVPWTAGSIYWAIVGRTKDWEDRYREKAAEIEGVVFVVDSTNLGFSVLAFIWVCILCLGLLYVRRRFLGGELGGPVLAKVASASCFVFCWCSFIGAVSWRSLRLEEMTSREQYTVVGFVATIDAVSFLIPVYLILNHKHGGHGENGGNGVSNGHGHGHGHGENGEHIKAEVVEKHLEEAREYEGEKIDGVELETVREDDVVESTHAGFEVKSSALVTSPGPNKFGLSPIPSLSPVSSASREGTGKIPSRRSTDSRSVNNSELSTIFSC